MSGQYPPMHQLPGTGISFMYIVLDHLRSAHNTGNIFRLAEAVGRKKSDFCTAMTTLPLLGVLSNRPYPPVSLPRKMKKAAPSRHRLAQ